MAIEVKIIGFGDERPPPFLGKNFISLELQTPTTPEVALRKSGFDGMDGLVLMTSDQVIPIQKWNDLIVEDGAILTVLSAFEGG